MHMAHRIESASAFATHPAAGYNAIMRAIILGSTGYSGELLLRLLLGHPAIEEIVPISSSQGGQPLPQWLTANSAHRAKLQPTQGRYGSEKELMQWRGEILFSALPHLRSATVWKPHAVRSVIIDLSADMRLKNATLFKQLYGSPPPCSALAPQAVYGLTELMQEQIKEAPIIANPGCYPTAILLPLLPLAQEGLLTRDIHIAAISGTSGAGHTTKSAFLLSERAENCGAYSTGSHHRHWGELQEQLPQHEVSFVPHLAPLARGIAATIFATVRAGATERDIIDIYNQRYHSTPFVRHRAEQLPHTLEVRGSNRCDFGWHLERQSLVICSVIDNLLKGASGQAVQNMNVRFGLPESSGLPLECQL